MSETQYAGSFTMTMAKAASNIDFFRGTLSDDACANWRVTINGVVSEQKANNLTFSEGDVIKIEYDTNDCLFHPGHDSDHNHGYISSITGSLPYFLGTDTTATVTNIDNSQGSGVFQECGDLTSISEELFYNWPNVTNFTRVFGSSGYSAPGFSKIPEKLFSKNTKVTNFTEAFCRFQSSARDVKLYIPENLFKYNTLATNFEQCFSYCYLEDIPPKLFINNINITNIEACFRDCNYVNQNSLIFKSENITNTKYFNQDSSKIFIVYVPENSITRTTFINSIDIESPENGSYVKVIEGEPIEESDTPLVSMVLIDDNNNRTTFNGPIINDFTITEDLQSKINQLTTLATNISNLQTRLTNITDILNTQNIEFTDNVSDVSSAGSKLYIQPQVYLKLVINNTTPVSYRYINITPYVTGKYNFTDGTPLSITVHTGYEYYSGEFSCYFGPSSATGLSVQVGGTTESISSINIGGSTVYSNNSVNYSKVPLSSPTMITIDSVSGSLASIELTLTK